MYQALLTRKYLTSKVMPLLSALAVLLCTMMVLIVWSIMGGFLDMLLNSGRTLMGDVAITWPHAGFAYYDDLQSRLEKHPAIAATAPLIDTGGMLKLPDNRTEFVTVKGIEGASYNRVTDYAGTLWWKPIDAPLPKDRKREDPRLENHPKWQKLLDDGLRLRETDPATGRDRPAAVLGTEVSGFNIRLPSGVYVYGSVRSREADGSLQPHLGFISNDSVWLTVFPVAGSGRAQDQVTKPLPVANEFKTGIYEIDSKTVLVELGELQRMLKMDAAAKAKPRSGGRYDITIGPDGRESIAVPETLGTDPARVTTVLVRGKDRVPLGEVAAACASVYTEFAAAHPGQVPPPPDSYGSIIIQTWEQRQGTMVAAVKKEIVMVVGILLVVSLVATFMILAIFWAMVSEKTKDIGVLRSIGASRTGIASLWLGYGLLIGVIGSLLGALTASLIVWNINPIHEWLGRAMNVQIWDPKVYYFVEIPNHVEPWKAAVCIAGGIVFSVAGALIPAWHAARMDPVQSLRFE